MGTSSSQLKGKNSFNLIWIDANINKGENKYYVDVFRKIYSLSPKLFEKVDEAINYLKKIKFEETKIIISGSLYSDFLEKFKENISHMFCAPKIIIFTGSKEKFAEYNPEYFDDENQFYHYGGVVTYFDGVKDFVFTKKKEQIFCPKLLSSNEPEKINLIFEPINNLEKLMLPLFFKSLINNTPKESLDEYTKYLSNKYFKENNNIKQLFSQIELMKNIPIEILSKYYIRLFSSRLSFYQDINKSLESNDIEKYLPFIQTLYEGIKLKALPLASNYILYKGSKVSYNDIFKISDCLEKKFKGLPGVITFSKSFMLFTKDKYYAQQQIILEKIDKKFSKVLFIIESNDEINYNISTHCDIENISFFPEDSEVLFFPFSSFEIKEIKEIKLNQEKIYEIDLLYLGKYLKDIENDYNLINNKIKLLDSEFKKQLSQSGLIQKEIMLNLNNKDLYDSFKKAEKDIEEIKNIEKNVIIGEINVEKFDTNRDIQIINSFENVKREYKKEDAYDDYTHMNENEIKENIEIIIDGKPIEFSYLHKFQSNGKHKIKYLFHKNITKINHMFYKCNNIIKLNLSNFHAENVTNMSHLFQGNKYLKYINLDNVNTENVTNMCEMFKDCKSLTSLDLSFFNTKNVTDMSLMFYECCELKNINISNFSTQNVKDMRFMFYGCSNLIKLNLSSFNTQNVLDMSEMFNGCKNLKYLDLSNFDTENAIIMISMFHDCSALKKENIITKDAKILEKFGH